MYFEVGFEPGGVAADDSGVDEVGRDWSVGGFADQDPDCSPLRLFLLDCFCIGYEG